MNGRQYLLLLLVPALGACFTEARAQGRAPAAAARSPQNVVNRSGGNWAPRCTAAQGCAAPAALPRCAQGINARAFAQVIDQRLTLAGQRVSVRGQLQLSVGCTEMACTTREGLQDCCNHCSPAQVLLRGQAQSALTSLQLGTEAAPAMACTGDESGLCCSLAVPPGDVVATGVLTAIPNSGGQYRLESPQLCTP